MYKLLFVIFYFSVLISHFTLSKSIKSHLARWSKIAPSIIAPLAIISCNYPTAVIATPLGEHTSCAYPACVSKIEILESNNPGLVPNEVKKQQIDQLKDVFLVLSEIPSLVEQKDYNGIRKALRVAPADSLRLTARKIKFLIEPSMLNQFQSKYQKMIDSVDYMDVLSFKRLQGSSSDLELSNAVNNAISSYSDFLKSVVLVNFQE
jgi:hypothetical protein